MKVERDKFLTETMGELWNNELCPCEECKSFWTNTNFSTWEGFGKLWEWSQKQIGFSEMISQTCYYEMRKNEFSKGYKKIIHPDYFANAVYNYLEDY